MTPVSVAVGILMNDFGEVLIAQRTETARYPLKWEFPGGKVEQNETFAEALIRELKEELTIDVLLPVESIHQQVTTYEDGGTFTVTFFLVKSWKGTIENKVWNTIRWESIQALESYDMLEGNIQMIKLLRV